jgi:hypothetical protein
MGAVEGVVVVTGGWAATNTLRGGIGRCGMVKYHAPGYMAECPKCFQERESLDALVLVEAALAAAAKVDDLTAVLPDDMDVLWTACEELHAALRAVREGK